MRRLLLFLMIFSAVPALPSFASEKEDVKKGNILYNEGDYSGAAKLYEKAAMDKPASGIPNFNRGAALYKDGSHYKAIEAFNKSIASGQADLISAADYNIGNSTYKTGELKDKADKEKKGIKKTAEIYAAALQYYKRAIDLDPNDKDAKFNYEFVGRKLQELSPLFQIKQEEEKKKEQEKKQDQQQKDQQQNKDQQDKEKKSEDQQDGGGKSEDKQQPQDKQDGQQGEQQNKGGESEDKQSAEGGSQGTGDTNKEQQGSEKPQSGEGQDKSASEQDKNKEVENKPERGSGAEQNKESGQSEEEKAKAAQAEKEKADKEKAEKQAQEEKDKAEALQGEEEKDSEAQEIQEGQGTEDGKKPEEKQGGLAAYQGAGKQAEAGEMTGQEANMLLEGYKGEEATGRAVKMRQKPINIAEPARDW